MDQEKRDRRVERTRKLLHEALVSLIIEKDFEKVTVEDVVTRANVGRSTFYSHFKDIDDLFLSGFENLWSLFQRHLDERSDTALDAWALSLVIFEHAQSYTDIYKALVGKQGGRLMTAHLHKYISLLIRKALQAQWAGQKPIPLEVAVYHLTSSLLALLAWWVDHGLPYSPTRMNEIYRQLTQPAIAALEG